MKLLFTCCFLFLVFVLCTGCSSKKNEQEIQVVETKLISKEDSILLVEVSAMPDTKPIRLRRYTESDVAKFTMAAIMGKSPKIISVVKSASLYIVSYVRPSDSQRFTYKVKIENNQAIWANIDGRWRDTSDDERITYNEVGKKLKITQNFSDGSFDEKIFSK